MKKVVLISLALVAVSAGSVLAKGDPAAGQIKAGGCQNCHGLTGVSPTDMWPNLAGQKYAYLVKQLKAYREGTRKNGLMQGMAKSLTDRDIENLAAYYAAMQPPTSSVVRTPAVSAAR